MMIYQELLNIDTPKRGFTNLTLMINHIINKQIHSSVGLCNLFIKHTSASLIVCENADSQVRSDLEAFMYRLVPDGDPIFFHTAEGLDDMPAHVRSILTQTSLVIPIQAQQLALGTWQGIYLWEHRQVAHQRQILVTILS